jgi:hypothetical protein
MTLVYAGMQNTPLMDDHYLDIRATGEVMDLIHFTDPTNPNREYYCFTTPTAEVNHPSIHI